MIQFIFPFLFSMTIFGILGDQKITNKHVMKMLLMFHSWMTKEDLITKIDDELDSWMLDVVMKDYYRYVNDKEPLEYIMWYVEFANRKLFVDRNTMIPRPETEYMIDAVVEEINNLKLNVKLNIKENVIIDVGTGCGVLGISAFLSNDKRVDKLLLMDYYPECLITAKKNMLNLLTVEQQVKVELVHSNLLQWAIERNIFSKNNNVIVTANLPYIPTETFDQQAEENVHLWEPRYAFISGEDGLDLYREMFEQVKPFEDSKYVMFLEMMTWQVDILRKEFEWLEFEEVRTFHFQIRIVKASLKKVN